MLLPGGGVEYPGDVHEHDEGGHHEAGHDGDPPHPRVVQRQNEEGDAHQDGHVPASAAALFL